MKNFTRAMVVYGSFRYGKSELGGQNRPALCKVNFFTGHVESWTRVHS